MIVTSVKNSDVFFKLNLYTLNCRLSAFFFQSAIGMNFVRLAKKGISFIQEPFFRSLLQAIYHHKLRSLMKRTKIQIPLDKGRIMMGTSDETRTFEQGQVFIQYSKETHLPGKNIIAVEGDVVVTKKPVFS